MDFDGFFATNDTIFYGRFSYLIAIGLGEDNV